MLGIWLDTPLSCVEDALLHKRPGTSACTAMQMIGAIPLARALSCPGLPLSPFFPSFRARTELLDYLHVVTKNQSEKVMTKIVDFVSGSSDMDFLERWVASYCACLLSR